MRPDACETIGLEFQTDRRRTCAAHAALLRFSLDAKNILNVVPDLMGEDIGLREFPRGSKAPLQLIVKTQIDVDPFVAGTIEGAGGRFRATACRLRVVAKQYELCMVVLAAGLLREDLRPGVLRVVQDE